jgi:5'-methylthioadenosine phosphorylase
MKEKSVGVGVIGGTGIYDPEIIKDSKKIKVYTPFGATSDQITIGNCGNKKMVFLPRHGSTHQIPPHKINYRANIWALKSLGVEQIIASNACGSLREDYKPGDFVITDQYIDRTRKRLDTFYEGGRLAHISSADPVCPRLHDFMADFAISMSLPVHSKGTYVCIEGPRFSTRAESKIFRQWGCDIIGMTMHPEAILAREAELCYVSVAMVTDYDVWAEKPVTSDEVIETMTKNNAKFKSLIMGALKDLPMNRTCDCKNALKNALL